MNLKISLLIFGSVILSPLAAEVSQLGSLSVSDETNEQTLDSRTTELYQDREIFDFDENEDNMNIHYPNGYSALRNNEGIPIMAPHADTSKWTARGMKSEKEASAKETKSSKDPKARTRHLQSEKEVKVEKEAKAEKEVSAKEAKSSKDPKSGIRQ